MSCEFQKVSGLGLMPYFQCTTLAFGRQKQDYHTAHSSLQQDHAASHSRSSNSNPCLAKDYHNGLGLTQTHIWIYHCNVWLVASSFYLYSEFIIVLSSIMSYHIPSGLVWYMLRVEVAVGVKPVPVSAQLLTYLQANV